MLRCDSHLIFFLIWCKNHFLESFSSCFNYTQNVNPFGSDCFHPNDLSLDDVRSILIEDYCCFLTNKCRYTVLWAAFLQSRVDRKRFLLAYFCRIIQFSGVGSFCIPYTVYFATINATKRLRQSWRRSYFLRHVTVLNILLGVKNPSIWLNNLEVQ